MTNKENNFEKDINVPRKEQIIINGVDVSECIDFNKRDKVSCYHLLYDKCNENPNCNFKQLARKTQECEELKKELNGSEKWRVKAESLNEKQDLENTRYRKALEEIGKIVKINCEEICGRKFEDCNDFLCSSKNILDIINKAKGEE